VTRRARVRITGAVQGVWFRESMRQTAERLTITGWVRNAADGSVEAVFEGEASIVERIIDFCRMGPPMARIDAVQVADETPEGLTGFTIR
jgi:acylphosphatase